jgi:cytochrome c oxidase cbb3-type subunit 2
VNKLLLIAGGSTLVYAVLAIVMGVLPGIALTNTPAGSGVEPLTPLQAEGRDVYVANGCSYCHTQQVRPLAQDKTFGRPSAPGDFAYQTPELLGSQRTGPDLTNIGVRQPSVTWQYIHLYNPRAVVPQSSCPRSTGCSRWSIKPRRRDSGGAAEGLCAGPWRRHAHPRS